MSENKRRTIALISFSLFLIALIVSITYQKGPTTTSVMYLGFVTAIISIWGTTFYDAMGDPTEPLDPTGQTTKSVLIHFWVVSSIFWALYHLFYYWVLNPNSNAFFTMLFNFLFNPKPQ